MTAYETGFTIPTLDQLIARKDADLAAQLSGADPYVEGSDAWIIARDTAGGDFLTHGMIGSALREWFPDCATDANLPRIGLRYGLPRNLPTHSIVTVTVTATGAVTIPAGTLLIASSGDYLTTGAVVIAAPGTGTLTVQSVEFGVATRLAVGATLTFGTSLPNLNATGTVASVVTDGNDDEDLEVYRSRILARIASVPQGGAQTDYEIWTAAIAGITRSWVDSPVKGVVRIVYDGSPVGGAGAVLTTLEALAPVCATLLVYAETDYTIGFCLSIKALAGYSTATIQTNVMAALKSLCDREAAPASTIFNSQFRTAIGEAAGVDYFIITNCKFNGGLTGSANSDATCGVTEIQREKLADMAWAWL